MNNIVLIQLRRPIRNAHYYAIDLCRNEEEHGTTLGTCSMGSTFAQKPYFPIRLKETFFQETKFLSRNIYDMRLCREDTVCVERLPGDKTSNLCLRDDGAPLYAMKCGSMVPDCLYGIASHYDNFQTRYGGQRCTGGSYFASIPHSYDWISRIVFEQWKN